MTDETSQPSDEPARAAERRPALALVANLLIPPVGHFYVGAARRGVLLGLAVRAITAASVLPILIVPGLASMVAALLVAIAMTLVMVVDGVVLARRERHGYRPRSYNRWYVYVGVAALSLALGSVLSTAIRTQIKAYRMPAASMSPTLLDGDYFFADRTPGRRLEPHRGDVIVFPYPGDPTKDFAKRVIGLPNDVIEIKDKRVSVNATALHEPYVVYADSSVRPRDLDPRDNFGPYLLGPDQLFVMGDNRDNSNDSRYWGPLHRRAVRGKAIVIYWSWDKEKASVRWGRIGVRL